MTQAGIGAVYLGDDSTFFRVWAPEIDRLQVSLIEPRRVIELEKDARGYHAAIAADVRPGTRYLLRLPDGSESPDPASRYQPDGVHGPSSVVDLSEFPWSDAAWMAPAFADFVIYELHVGTFTRLGTFGGVIEKLDYLRALGINAIEIMPLAQFPGARNWGYDGVFPFAVQNTYGGPSELMRLVDACHARGMAVILDVVYNHLGPEGNILGRFAPYFNGRYVTPWGPALNFDDAYSDCVREYFLENARQWLRDYHFDALRLDAVHAILDTSAYPFLTELADRTREDATNNGRQAWLIAESDLNDPRTFHGKEAGGHGLDAQWADDFHHALHALLTGESDGYYADFGRVADLAACFHNGFTYTGQYSVYRKRRHGQPAQGARTERFVVCLQNHDQVGNRMLGDRISTLIDFEALKLGAAAVLLSPFVPLIFMGEEYGETGPFPYFVSHSDTRLIEAVRSGRAQEFAAFGWAGEPPDPQADHTFESAVLEFDTTTNTRRENLLRLYRELIRLRLQHRTGDTALSAVTTEPDEEQKTLTVAWNHFCAMFSFSSAATLVTAPPGRWKKILDTADKDWSGPGGSAQTTVRYGDKVDLRPWNAAFYLAQS